MANQQQPNEPQKRQHDRDQQQRTSQPPTQQPEAQPDLGNKEDREENIQPVPKKNDRPS